MTSVPTHDELLAPEGEQLELCCTRCPVPTAFSVAIANGWIDDAFAQAPIRFRSLGDGTSAATQRTHFTQGQQHLFRHGVCAFRARVLSPVAGGRGFESRRSRSEEALQPRGFLRFGLAFSRDRRASAGAPWSRARSSFVSRLACRAADPGRRLRCRA
jgi:hypothetical protein